MITNGWASPTTTHGERQPRVGEAQPDPWLTRFLEDAKKVPHRSARSALKKVLANPSYYRFQLLITEYNPEADPSSRWSTHAYRVDHEYVYPASAIKVFGSLAALREVTILQRTYPWLDIRDPMGIKTRSCQRRDRTNEDGRRASLLHEIKKTQLVSSNVAFNTVFNVTGFQRLHEHIIPDFPSVRVHHRLSSRETHEDSLKTPVLRWCDETLKADRRVVSKTERYTRPRFTSSKDISSLTQSRSPSAPTGYGTHPESMKVGQAYLDMKTKERIEEPMDFTYKNRVSFFDLQRVMIGIALPPQRTPLGPAIALLGGGDAKQQIKAEWVDALRHSMVIYPRQSTNPIYRRKSLSETRFKPLIRGVREGLDRPDDDLYYLNKAGKALGFHLDSALIAVGEKSAQVDPTGRPIHPLQKGLFITVGLYVNEDQTLNDDHYEYKSISVPLFDAIGYAAGRYLSK